MYARSTYYKSCYIYSALIIEQWPLFCSPWKICNITGDSDKSMFLGQFQKSQPLRFERNDYDILLPLRLLCYMSRSLRQRRIPNSPKNSCCKRLKQAVAANRVISENKTCTLLNILPPLVIHISSFPLTSSLCVAGWPNFGGSAYCVGDWLTSRRVFWSRAPVA